jgi:hypothetical protein
MSFVFETAAVDCLRFFFVATTWKAESEHDKPCDVMCEFEL